MSGWRGTCLYGTLALGAGNWDGRQGDFGEQIEGWEALPTEAARCSSFQRLFVHFAFFVSETAPAGSLNSMVGMGRALYGPCFAKTKLTALPERTV